MWKMLHLQEGLFIKSKIWKNTSLFCIFFIHVVHFFHALCHVSIDWKMKWKEDKCEKCYTYKKDFLLSQKFRKIPPCSASSSSTSFTFSTRRASFPSTGKLNERKINVKNVTLTRRIVYEVKNLEKYLLVLHLLLPRLSLSPRVVPRFHRLEN